VVAVDDVGPRIQAVTFSSSDLVGFRHQPGQDLMMTFPLSDRLARRRYTISQSDPDAGTYWRHDQPNADHGEPAK
jgi:ferredoxin-NADP reductase